MTVKRRAVCIQSLQSTGNTPLRNLSYPLLFVLCKIFFPLSALNSEADAIGRRWETFESQSAILSE